MTKRERQMQSMLNYYGIDMGGQKDERLNKRDLKQFLDNINNSYDSQTVGEIFKKIRDKLKDNEEQNEEDKDPFFDSLKKDEEKTTDEELNGDFPIDFNSLSNRRIGYNDPEMQNFGFMNLNPDIEKFISWISDTLYSADHKVTITEENGVTIVKLEKIKKKRGGRKK